MRRAAPKGRTLKNGCCNETVSTPDNFFGFQYCWRPDNGSGICNVHEAARKAGAKRRKTPEQRVRDARTRAQILGRRA